MRGCSSEDARERRRGAAGRPRTRADSGGAEVGSRPTAASIARDPVACVRRRSRTPWMQQPLVQRPADAPPGIERRAGILVHVLDGVAHAARRLAAPGRRRSAPSRQDRRPRSRAAGRAMVRPSVVLPQPDSPTRPRTRPPRASRLTPSRRAPAARSGRRKPLAAAEQHGDDRRRRGLAPASCAYLHRSGRSRRRGRRTAPAAAAPARAGGARSRQRGAKRQPAGRAKRRRHRAGDADERLRAVGMAGQQRRACRDATASSRIAPHGAGLDGLAGIDDADVVAELGDDAEVVGDEQHRDAELGDQLAQQQQDLLLRRDVERRGRLVGDAPAAARRRARRRSAAAGAGRRRTGADSARARRSGSGSCTRAQKLDQPGAHAGVGARPPAAARASA